MVRVCAQSFGVSGPLLPPLPSSRPPLGRSFACIYLSKTGTCDTSLSSSHEMSAPSSCAGIGDHVCGQAGVLVPCGVGAPHLPTSAQTDREQEINITKARTRAHAHTFKRCTSSSRLIMPLERPTARRSRMQQITSTHTPRQLHVRIIAVKYISERGVETRVSRAAAAVPQHCRVAERQPEAPDLLKRGRCIAHRSAQHCDWKTETF